MDESKNVFNHIEQTGPVLNQTGPDAVLKAPEDLTNFVIDNSQYHSPLNDLSFWQTIRVCKKAAFFGFIGAFGALSDNFQLSVPGQILALPGFIETFGDPDPTARYGKTIAPSRVSAWGGISTAGNIIIVLISTLYSPHDRFGRKPLLYCVQLTMMAACLIEMFTSNWGVWALAKFLNGISVGLNQQVATTYVAEIAPTNIRGAMLNMYSVWWGIGGFAAAITLECVSNLPASQWRRTIYAEWVFSGTALLCLLLVPETTRYYAIRGNHEKALQTLESLFGGCENYDVTIEYEIIRKEVEDGLILASQSSKTPLLAIFRGSNLRRTLISTWPFAWQMWLGVPIIFSYVSYFFQLAGLERPFLATVSINTVYLVALFAAIPLVEKVGRRLPLLIGGGIIVLILVALSLLDHWADRVKGAGTGLVALACLWMAVYSLTAGPLGYVYLAETSTVLLRAKTISAALVLTQCQNFFGSYAVPYMLNGPNFGITGTAGFFAGGAFIGWILVFLYIPETKRRSFVELDELFERRIPARHFVSTETSVDVIKRRGGAIGDNMGQQESA